mmetsp:Transcript_11409/g.27613  ORF Transcript_11409/g.27613 Transcript_11409/m.27613 type:complete len:185 (-) Transcript_11409:43-597(-)
MEDGRGAKLATGCLGCFTLAQGVNIIAGIDLFQGILTVALGLLVFMMPEHFRGHALAHHYLYNETTMLAVFVMSSIGGVSAYFAWCALRGVRNVDAKLLWRFFLWKAGRAFFFSLLLFSDLWKTIGTPVLGNYFTLFVVATTWRVYLLWIIFSLHERIMSNDVDMAGTAGYTREDLDEHMPIVP